MLLNPALFPALRHRPTVLWAAMWAALPCLGVAGVHAQEAVGIGTPAPRATAVRALPEVVVRDSAWSLIPAPVVTRGGADLAPRRAATSDTAQLLADVPGVSWVTVHPPQNPTASDPASGGVMEVDVLGHQAGWANATDPALDSGVDELIGNPRLHLASLHR